MKCINCGAEFEEGTLFCPVCGKEVQWVPEYNTLETLIKQRELQEQEKKRREQEAQKEREKEQRRAEQERRRRQKKNRTAAGLAAGAALLVGGGLFFVYQTQRNSFDFQLAQAESEFSNKDYESAFKYVDRALALRPDSPEANVLEAKIYLKEGNEAAARSILESVAKENPDNTNAYGELLRLYEQKEEYEKIRELMEGASEKMRSTYKSYVCSLPEPSVKSGSYSEEQTISFEGLPDGVTVYYTLDKSQPSKESQVYEEGIEITGEGTTVLKYIAYNEKSIPSQMGEETYTLSFEAPEAPEISPVSDEYEYQTNIIVTAPKDCMVFYAFDQEPTLESDRYEGPIPMPEGEHTFSAIAVDERGKISQVSSAVYVYYGE